MILAFKLVTSIIIFVMAPTAHAFIFLVVMQWYNLLLPIPLIVVPLLFWLRLRRVRKKRRQLILSEWAVDAEADWNPTSVRGTM
jgi:Flp pilus assembly protein TadB